MRKFLFLQIVLLLGFTISSCKNEEQVEPLEKLDIKLYKPSSDDYDPSKNYLQASFSSEGQQLSTFGPVDANGIPGPIKYITVSDSLDRTDNMILLDETGEPAFMYDIDITSGERGQSLIEFEKLTNDKIFVRIYHYDWDNRIGTLLLESELESSGDSFVGKNTFLTDLREISSLRRGRVTDTKGNRSYQRPIGRLDNISKNAFKRPAVVNYDIGDFVNMLDTFRKSTVEKIWQNSTNVGAVITLLGVAASTTTVSPLVLAGVGLIVAGKAVPFFASDRWTNALMDFKNTVNSVTTTISELDDVIIETFEGYEFPSSVHWPSLHFDSFSLEAIRNSIDQYLTTDNESLDDLPDSNGVLQIGLSWDTDGTDVDLWVFDPSGERIYWQNPNSASGGYLDRDDVDGFGPENVYWNAPIPNGEYSVIVHYFSCEFGESAIDCRRTNFDVKVSNGLGDILETTASLNEQTKQQGPLKFIVQDGRILPYQ